MRYVVVRCEDAAAASERTPALLEGAKALHLQHLAQAGAGGMIRRRREGRQDPLALHRALLGLSADDPEGAPARWYAASVNAALANGETAWCCELVTQQDGRIVDATAGRIPTKESRVLLQSVNDQLGSDVRRWELIGGSHHLFVARGAALTAPASVPSPTELVGQRWRPRLPRGPMGEVLRALIEQTSAILEAHPINRVRLDLGENPANLMWFWGPASQGKNRSIAQRTGRSGAIISSSPMLRGAARALGLDWQDGPTSLEERALRRVGSLVESLAGRHELVYLHLRFPSADPVERQCAMERVDQRVLKPLTEHLAAQGPWRLCVALDDWRNGATSFVALGTGLPQHGLPRLTAEAFAASRLAFADAPAFFSWFTANA